MVAIRPVGHDAQVRGTQIGAAVVVLSLTLAGCAEGGPTAAERSRATSLPTPTASGPSPQRLLSGLVRAVAASPSVAVDEDYVVDGRQTEVRLAWRAAGSVVDASVLPIGRSGPGTEVFRSPGAFLSRPTGAGAACWSRAGSSVARFAGPPTPELGALLSSRAVRADGSLIAGSMSARSVLEIVGTDAELSRRSLLPPAGVRVAATFAPSRGGLQVTIAWSALVAAAGNSSRHTRQGTWTLWFRPGSTGTPAAPPTAEVVSVPPTDPAFAAALRDCNSRLQ